MSVTFALQPGAAITIANSSGGTFVIPSYGATPAPVLLSTVPIDNAQDFSATDPWVATFDLDVQFGTTGQIRFQHLFTGSGGWQVVETFNIPATIGSDLGQVEIIDNQLFIRPSITKVAGRQYNVQVDGGTIESLSGTPWAGITNNLAWTAFITEEGGGESLAIPLSYDGLLPNPITPAMLSGSGYDWAKHISSPGGAVTYGATSLPGGVSMNSSTGRITGTFTGTDGATLTASNGTTPSVSVAATFTA